MTTLARRAVVIYCAPGKDSVAVGVARVGEGPIVAGSLFVTFMCVIWGDEVFEDKSG